MQPKLSGRVRGLQVWETDAFHHDGIADDGAAIVGRLLSMTAAQPAPGDVDPDPAPAVD